jgi:two-component system, cell cycle sensor histidine kinase and response regulator CckA
MVRSEETFSNSFFTKAWIKDRLAIEEAVAEISRIILSPDLSDFIKVLPIMGRAASVNRTYITRFHEDAGKIFYVYEWCDATDVVYIKHNDNDLDKVFYPALIKRLECNENIMFPDVEALPFESAIEKETLKSRGVRSLLVIPIFSSSGLLAGSIGFENTKKCREWLGEEVQNLRVISGMIGIYWERSAIVSALKKSEEKYRELYEEVKKTEAVYRSLINSSADAIVMSDMAGEITYINPSFVKLFGWSLEEMRDCTAEFMPHSEKFYYIRLIRDIVEKGSPCCNLETRRRTKEGKLMDVSLSISRYDDHEGKPAGMLYVFRDNSERKQLEAQLIQAQKMEAVGTLAGGIAHDFNNNLQGIYACTEILLMGKEEDHPDFSKLKTIEKSAERAGNLTKQLLVFGRKVENKFEPVDLNHEIRQISNILERTIPKMIRIQLDLEENIRKIKADPGQLEQIMMNLGVNARDAMPDGGALTFKTEEVILDDKYCAANPIYKTGIYALLSVSDTGCGMKQEVLEHIFEPFFTTKKKGKGTGLGLSMVYGIVKNHGGNITCTSAPGIGTTFKIYFPVAEYLYENKIKNESGVLIKGNNETILLVDDEETNRELGKEILEGLGYKTITVSDGESALEYYRENKEGIDLIIMDLIMPGMGGSVCLNEILKFDREAKVIIASGFTSDKSTLDSLKYAAKDIISKPYNGKMMLKVIQSVLC